MDHDLLLELGNIYHSFPESGFSSTKTSLKIRFRCPNDNAGKTNKEKLKMVIKEKMCRIADHLASTTPEVSVCTTVYNAERFIAQTIDGVLNQETSFPVEFVISDDCSTDESSMIIEDYAKRFPHIIRFRPNKKNMGLNANFMATMRECRGKYIALLSSVVTRYEIMLH